MTTSTVPEPSRIRAVYASLRGVLIVTPWVLHLLVTDVVLSALLPVSYFFPTFIYNVSSRLASLVWRGIQTIFTSFNRARLTTSGAHLPKHESAIVISNHVSWADFYLIQHLALKSGMLGRCRWFAKEQLKWVPFLGWGLWAMGMPLISRNWDKDQRELDRVFKGPKAFRWPMWLISYSESTRYTPEKYSETVQWCKSHNKPVPEHTLYPRTRGFVATVKQLRKSSSIKAVYDLTIAYAHGGRFFEAPAMWTTLSEPRMDKEWRFHVHAERFSIEEFAGMSDAEIAFWLEQRWMEKSKRLEELRRDLEKGTDWSDESGKKI